MKTGIQLIAAERRRQVAKEGWSAKHDDDHTDEGLALAAACYALPRLKRDFVENVTPGLNRFTPMALWQTIWPWAKRWWKPTPKNRIRELVKAGALLAAEIDRLQRAR